MKPDLPDRARQLHERLKLFPEAKWTPEGLYLKKDAGAAFLDLRQMLEREILAALDELAKVERK